MAIPRYRNAGGSQRLTYQFLTSLFLLAVFNLNEAEARSYTSRPRVDGNLLDIEPTEESSTTPDDTHIPVVGEDGLTPLVPITVISISTSVSKPDKYEPYLRGMVGRLGKDDLEYALDYYNEKALMKEYDFDSMDLVKKLADSAAAHNTTPEEFLGDIQDLISLQNRSRTEQADTSGRDETPNLQGGFLSENLLKRMSEGWKTELKRLEKKYNVSSECNGPDSITATRLALMFPHYLNFGQKPFAAPSNITLGETRTIYRDNYGNEISYETYNNHRYNYNGYTQSTVNGIELPSIFKHPEFSGMIPRNPSVVSESHRKTIIGIHLYALHHNNLNDMVPFRTKCVMLKRRMEKSTLSEDRRVRFLRNNDIFQLEGLIRAYNAVPSDFKRKVDSVFLEVFA